MASLETRQPAEWIQTASGFALDLRDPAVSRINFAGDVAPALARLPRWTGHIAAGPYSVAQHSVIGARAILPQSPRLAALFLLHDAHEAYLGDIATPVRDALAAETGAPDLVRHALATLKGKLDAAIHAAAGLPPPRAEERDQVHRLDMAMLEAERRQLMGPCERPWTAGTEPLRINGALSVWPWARAADSWLELFRQLCPRATS